MRFFIPFILCFLNTFIGLCQSMTGTKLPDTPLQDVIPIPDQTLNYEEQYESLAHLLAQKFDLNRITREQLQIIPGLSDEKIDALMKYRETLGPFLSVYELQAVPGWDREDVNRLASAVYVKDEKQDFNASIFSRIRREPNNYLLFRIERILEDKKGFSNKATSSQRYVGSPEKYYLRYRVSRPGDFSVGFTMEKDPGEKFVWAPDQQKYGADFLSFHIQLSEKRRWKNLIVGDFQAQFGQGLILGSVFGFGKNSETITSIRRSNLGFLPYTSVQENQMFTGIAVSYCISKPLTLHGFVSRTNIDGHVDGDSSGVISSLPTAGLHRTLSEQLQRKQQQKSDAGLVLQFRKQSMDMGLLWQATAFNNPVLRTTYPYNQFAFSGIENQNAGAYLNFSLGSATLFGEFASTLAHGTAFNFGMLAALSPKFELSIHYRRYDRDFYSFQSNAFSENTTPQNEEGIYWGWKYQFNKKFLLTGYMDIFQFPWLRYRAYRPTSGSEWMLRFSFSPSKTIHTFIQYREEIKSKNSEPGTVYRSGEGIRRNYWIHCDYKVNTALQFRTRVQVNSYEFSGHQTSGIAITEDVSFSWKRFTLSARYALFDTDFENRVYTYERDVWLSYSYPAYEGLGTRTCLLLTMDVSKKFDLSVRWGQTRFSDRNKIGSGSDEIEGNTRNDVKFQARISF